jgi:hypothetical protein
MDGGRRVARRTAVRLRLTTAEGRAFGLTVGGALLGLGALLAWRGARGIAPVLLLPGGLLVLAGLVLPTRLGPVRRAWMELAHAISRVTTPITMGIVYFAVITPIGVLRRAVGSDPLRRPPTGESAWVDVPPEPGSMERQF